MTMGMLSTYEWESRDQEKTLMLLLRTWGNPNLLDSREITMVLVYRNNLQACY